MKKKKIIILIIIAILVIAGGIYYFISSRFQYNDDNAVGNTAGNLNNGGLFCEYKDKIYFANPYDNNHLYVMNSDCTGAKRLSTDSVSYINVYGNYIYYVKNNFTEQEVGNVFRGQLYGVSRTDLNGQNPKTLYSDLSGIISISGNYLIYQHHDNKTALSLYKTNIDGSDNKKIYDTAYNPSSVLNGKIYFADNTDKNRIKCMDVKTNSISLYSDESAYLVDAKKDYIYYIDPSKNYSLVRANASTKTVEMLYDAKENGGRIVNYNLYGNKIFFQFEGDNNPGLYRMNSDGTQVEYIATGNFNNVSCTSQYTFFQYFDQPDKLYRVPTTGAMTSVEQITIKQ